jgi:acyl dehydratase
VRVFPSPVAMLQHVGDELGSSGWLTLDQARVDTFADATEDHQWIHVDPARAANGPFGATIAHGYLTLALAGAFLEEIYRVDGAAMIINYGVDRVRFPSPVPVGSRIRGSARLSSADRIGDAVQAVVRLTVEIERGTKPACVADLVMRLYADSSGAPGVKAAPTEERNA